jgi:hypothetical protein
VVDGVKGTLALGLDLNYDTLLVPALDEVSSSYGLLAEVLLGGLLLDLLSVTRGREMARRYVDYSRRRDFLLCDFKKLSPQAAANYRHVVKAKRAAPVRSLSRSISRATAGYRRFLGNSPSCPRRGGREPIRTASNATLNRLRLSRRSGPALPHQGVYAWAQHRLRACIRLLGLSNQREHRSQQFR